MRHTDYIKVELDDLVGVLSGFESSDIVIDFDNTICAPNASEREAEKAIGRWRPTLKALTKSHKVVCISNGTIPVVAKTLLRKLEIDSIDKARKPFGKKCDRKADYVIGDLFITDGLLARRCGATFLYFREPKRFPRDFWTGILTIAGHGVRVLLFRRLPIV